MTTTNQGFGKPKYGGGGSFAKPLRLKENTTTVVRILPPMKSCAETGEWAVYHGTHFGYKGVNPRDPSKPSFRTFRCIEEKDFKTKMLLQDCPECDIITQREEELKDLQAQAKIAGHTSDEIEELAKPLKDWLREHNCDRKWHMHVKTEQGEFVTLQISHKTKKLLEAEILRIQTEDGIDALDLGQGAWLKFHRTGKGVETQDTVVVVYESVRDATTGRVNRTVKLAPLTEAEAEKALKECQDLHTVVRKVSHQQIKLLTQSSGEPEDVDKIFALGEKDKKERSAPPLPPKTLPGVVTKPVEKKPEPTVASPEADDEEARLEAQLAAARAARVARAAKAVESDPPPTSTESVVVPVESKPATPSVAAPAAGAGPVDRTAFMARFKKQ